ncbi:MAG: hypothetical protein J6Y07_03065 [Alphaproteobacteria bacterium]|nr:hypothetical protein [Alphaproteobacteria bacterium]
MFQNLRLAEYDIVGNLLRAWYDSDNKLVFVVDETIDDYKPNVLLVVRPNGTRRWDDLLQNVYDVDLEVVRPRRDNKYQKLDVEYGGIDVYENLIDAYEAGGDIEAALADLVDFRDAAVRRAATVRLTDTQDEIEKAKITAKKAEHTIKSLKDRIHNLQKRLERQKSYVGREPTKQSASRILRVEAQIESTDEKLVRAEKRLEKARRRVEIAREEEKSILALLALQRPSVGIPIKHKIIDAKAKKSDVAKMSVTDIAPETEQENNQEPQESKMPDNSEEVKPLLDKDPEILDEEIAFKPVEFADIKPAQTMESKRPLSPFDIASDEPKPEEVHDEGDKNDAAFGFPDATNDDINDDSDDALPHTDIDTDDGDKVEDKTIETSQLESSDKRTDSNMDDMAKSEFENNFRHDDFNDYVKDEEPKETVIDEVKSVDKPVPTDVDTTERISTAQYDNTGINTPKRPFSPMEASRPAVDVETRPVSPIQSYEKPRAVGVAEKRSGFAYYILLILLIVLSIFTLWLYQKKNGGTVPVVEPIVEPVPPIEPEPVQPIEPEPVPPIEPEPVQPIEPEPVPPIEPEPVQPVDEPVSLDDKPIEVRYPSDDVVRGAEPDEPLVESEDDVLSRKQAYGVSRDDKQVFSNAPRVTAVTAPDVIFEDEVVSVPMGDTYVDTVVGYDNPANVEYVQDYYVEQPQYIPAPQPQYVQEEYNNYYVEEPEPETKRNLTIHDGGQYSVSETVEFIPD